MYLGAMRWLPRVEQSCGSVITKHALSDLIRSEAALLYVDLFTAHPDKGCLSLETTYCAVLNATKLGT